MTDPVKSLREYLKDGPHDTYAPYEIAHEAITALEAVLDWHQPTETGVEFESDYCPTCSAYYPCPTVKAITDVLKGADDE